MAAACHAYGAKVSIQLQHAGPEGSSALTGYPLKAASAIPAAVGRETPEAVSKEELYRIIECYGDAARRAQQAGIDMVEVHCAHGYLVSTFRGSSSKTSAKRPAATFPFSAASTPATRFRADRACRMRRRSRLT